MEHEISWSPSHSPSDLLLTGSIIAVCTLKNCIKVTENNQSWAILEDGTIVSGNDYLLGDYREGNYAWIVQNMKILDQPIPAKGQLGLWEYEI